MPRPVAYNILLRARYPSTPLGLRPYSPLSTEVLAPPSMPTQPNLLYWN